MYSFQEPGNIILFSDTIFAAARYPNTLNQRLFIAAHAGRRLKKSL